MTPGAKIDRHDVVGRKDAQLGHRARRRAHRELLAQDQIFARKRLRHHLVSECRDHGHAALLAGAQVAQEIIRVMKMLVDIGHDYPIGAAATLLPA